MFDCITHMAINNIGEFSLPWLRLYPVPVASHAVVFRGIVLYDSLKNDCVGGLVPEVFLNSCQTKLHHEAATTSCKAERKTTGTRVYCFHGFAANSIHDQSTILNHHLWLPRSYKITLFHCIFVNSPSTWAQQWNIRLGSVKFVLQVV